jgi:hypothetical protein
LSKARSIVHATSASATVIPTSIPLPLTFLAIGICLVMRFRASLAVRIV